MSLYLGTKKIATNGGTTGDTLPVGSIVDYNGEQIPENWEQIEETASIVINPTEPTAKDEVWLKKSNNILSFSGFETQDINGIVITNNRDGSLTLHGTSTSEVSLRISNVHSNLKPGKYTLTRNISGTGDKFTLILYGKNESVINIHNQTDNTSQINVSTDYAEYYLWLYIGSGKTFSNYILKPQLEEGIVATSFSEYDTKKTIYIKNGNDNYEEFISSNNLVKVSNEKPNTGEKIWIKKGKNLFNRNKCFSETAISTEDGKAFYFSERTSSDFIEVNSNSSYIISNNNTTLEVNVCQYDENKTFIKHTVAGLLLTSSTTKYIRFYASTSVMLGAVQLEQNTRITPYEEYIEPVIYVKNENEIYEKFIKEDNNLIHYHFTEQKIGYWIDNKSLYRKIWTFTDIISTPNLNLGINFDTIVKATFMGKQADGAWRAIPWLFEWEGGFCITADNHVWFQVGAEIGNISTGHLILEYTKKD